MVPPQSVTFALEPRFPWSMVVKTLADSVKAARHSVAIQSEEILSVELPQAARLSAGRLPAVPPSAVAISAGRQARPRAARASLAARMRETAARPMAASQMAAPAERGETQVLQPLPWVVRSRMARMAIPLNTKQRPAKVARRKPNRLADRAATRRLAL